MTVMGHRVPSTGIENTRTMLRFIPESMYENVVNIKVRTVKGWCTVLLEVLVFFLIIHAL